MKNLVIGIVAHVDAGKTTLSEGLLYKSGMISTFGRVDKKDAFLDNHYIERERGITIFSKQAQIQLKDTRITLLDTPGHVDFSADMERSLQVLDYAILVISGADGVQGHTLTVWKLLRQYGIPTFLFINKMDQPGTNHEWLLQQLRKRLSNSIIDFQTSQEVLQEEIAMCEDSLLEEYLSKGKLSLCDIAEQIRQCKVYPCFFGSALHCQGVTALLEAIERYTIQKQYPEKFGARVFKVSRDEQNNCLVHMKITGGILHVKDVLQEKGENTEKVNQIRIYSGERYRTVGEAEAGTICTIIGPVLLRPGDGIGMDTSQTIPLLEPVLTYCILLPKTCPVAVMLPKLQQLQEEQPELHIVWNEELQQIQAKVMGEVQIEILKRVIEERYGVAVGFDIGRIAYKETIANTVEGMGHFEPLRHYAEVHVLLEPGAQGSGIQLGTSCSEDMLDKNWQRLILTHLGEVEHRGVLVGAPVTDMKITLLAGRAHTKHTEGGDFRKATYRALRQGLMQAKSVLLEPFYEYRMEVPEEMLGRAMQDLEQMHASFDIAQHEDGKAILTGSAPVIEMRNYQKELLAYTKGLGGLWCNVQGYFPCHNAEQVMEDSNYCAERDTEYPSSSVFCEHGTVYTVEWNQVESYMHIPRTYHAITEDKEKGIGETVQEHPGALVEESIGLDEIDAILTRTFYANAAEKAKWNSRKRQVSMQSTTSHEKSARPAKANEKQYLLIDAYNVIYAWENLKLLAKENLDAARGKLLDILCNYQAIEECELIVVFDAYRVKGHATEEVAYQNIQVVYTKEGETADRYIERYAHENGRSRQVTVVTSDGLEQITIRGQGCRLISAREFERVVIQAEQRIIAEYTVRLEKEISEHKDEK